MENIKKYRTILACGLSVFIFIIADTFLLPEKTQQEKIGNKESTIRISRKRASSFILFTSEAEYLVDENFYNNIAIGESITVTKSIISGSTKKISKTYYETSFSLGTRFLVEGAGALFVSFFMIAILLAIKFMPQLNSLKGDLNATIGLTTISILIFILYLFYF